MNITKYRKRSGLTQKQVGEALGIGDRAVSNWENGLSKPSTENLIKLARLFGISVEELCGDTASRQSSQEGMASLKELYRIGRGPSSSHTLAPARICRFFLKRYPQAEQLTVILYGSLAKMGKNSGTEAGLCEAAAPVPCTVIFDSKGEPVPHPSTLDMIGYRQGKELGRIRAFSVGGGEFRIEGEPSVEETVYPLQSYQKIAAYCRENHLRLWQYAEQVEGASLYDYIKTVWAQMKQTVQKGLNDEGILPGGLNVQKKAHQLLLREHIDESAETRENRLVSAFAFAVGEQNASGETVVTAPTCGAGGVVPAVLYYQQQKREFSDEAVIHALETAGIIGDLIKTNGSISGAECGCQAEIGSACAMAAAALGELFGLDLDKIEYAAEISIEHHLGLTCDPICGLLQIPCIERNAVAAMRAINAVNIASFLSDTRKISFDNIVLVMRRTGWDISNRYKETSEAGLAGLDIR